MNVSLTITFTTILTKSRQKERCFFAPLLSRHLLVALISTQRLIISSTLHLTSDDNDPFIGDTSVIITSSLSRQWKLLLWFLRCSYCLTLHNDEVSWWPLCESVDGPWLHEKEPQAIVHELSEGKPQYEGGGEMDESCMVAPRRCVKWGLGY